MRRAVLLAAIVGVGLGVTGLVAQRGRGGGGLPPTGAIEKVKDNLYVIHGGGGNTTVFLTQAGVVLVDTKLADNGAAIMNQVKTVTDKPVSMIINTHSHPDHIGSNNFFPPTIEKVTHENTRKWIAGNQQFNTPAFLPTRTFTDKMTLNQGADQIDLYYFGPGHTDGDAFVVFPAARAMVAGDIFAWKMAPLIDPAAGGSVMALPDSLEKAVKGIPNVDTVIEGHGDANTWAGFRDFAAFNRALLDAAKAGFGRQAPEDVVATLQPRFPQFTRDEMLPGLEYGNTPFCRAGMNVNVAYQEMRKEVVTTNFGPCPGKPEPARAGGAGRGGAPGGRGPGGTPVPTQK